MHRLVIVAALAAAALSGGCNGEDTYTPTGSETAKLHILQVWDESAGLYVEGARSYIAVETPAGDELLELELKETTRGYEQTARLDPGEYRLLSWQRPSAGDSDLYDPPTDRCSAPFTVSPKTPTLAKIEVRAGEGCKIEIE